MIKFSRSLTISFCYHVEVDGEWMGSIRFESKMWRYYVKVRGIQLKPLDVSWYTYQEAEEAVKEAYR